MAVCESTNTEEIDQEAFWNGRWDAHKVGWLIAGACASVATVITLFTVTMHCLNYSKRSEQRQIIRILFMPAVYAVVSFFSYRFFRAYTYYELSVIVYESLVLAAFLMLLLFYVGESTEEQKAVLMAKEKRGIPFPFCCIRYRPSKPKFLFALKWSVLQYSLLRPAISIAGIITNAFGVLCPEQYSVHFAEVYLEAVDFISISVALYGLIAFYALVKEQLNGKQPLAKFLNIKGIVMITFYQGFIFSVLESHGIIKATKYWTSTNVADGLQALATCAEMVIFSVTFLLGFHWRDYKILKQERGVEKGFFMALLDSFNYIDFLQEGWSGLVFGVDYMRGKPGTRSKDLKRQSQALNINEAFNPHGHDDPDSLLMKEKNGRHYDTSQAPSAKTPTTAGSVAPEPYGRRSKEQRRPSQSSIPPNAFVGVQYQATSRANEPDMEFGGRHPYAAARPSYSDSRQDIHRNQSRSQTNVASYQVGEDRYSEQGRYGSHHSSRERIPHVQQASYDAGTMPARRHDDQYRPSHQYPQQLGYVRDPHAHHPYAQASTAGRQPRQQYPGEAPQEAWGIAR